LELDAEVEVWNVEEEEEDSVVALDVVQVAVDLAAIEDVDEVEVSVTEDVDEADHAGEEEEVAAELLVVLKK
jgi:hypothetical protein